MNQKQQTETDLQRLQILDVTEVEYKIAALKMFREIKDEL